MPLSNFTQLQILQHYFQGLPLLNLGGLYLALCREAPGPFDDQSVGETTYAGYARLAIAPSPSTFQTSSGPPARAQNISALAFPACVGTGDTVSFWSLGLSAAGPGTIIASGPIVGFEPLRAFAGWAGSPGTLFVPNLPYGTQVNDRVALQQMGPGTLLPQGLVEGQLYYVGTVNVVTGNVTLSTTPDNGAPVATTSMGNGFYYPVTPMTIAQGMVPAFPPNSLLTFQG